MNDRLTEIVQNPYPSQMVYFRNMAKNYYANVFFMQSLEKQLNGTNKDCMYDATRNIICDEKELRKRFELFEESVSYVDTTLHKIEKRYGINSAKMVEKWYIQGKKKKSIAKEYNLSIQELDQRYQEWLNATI